MYEMLLVVYLIVSIILIGFVLVQQGKGAGMGASFGSGASNTVFGASGSGNFMTRTTAVLAIVFFVLSLALGNLSANKISVDDVFSDLNVSKVVEKTVKAPVKVEVDNSTKIPE
ncbi:preprotein translocase subunit SecG [Psychromonas sp. CD1]|uniref:preprotein translocase subunit SecG n=1 Tax=Psychromonas sp. CD1 TaxID=1979839 RepID=UPI000B9B87C2|nr:preprotein translocase subunit SecG [Psychromonas sp. CD1]